MMFTSTYTNKSMNVCSASANRAEASSACAETSNTNTQSARTIALVLDTVLGLIRLAALIILAVLLIMGQLNSDRSLEPARVR